MSAETPFCPDIQAIAQALMQKRFLLVVFGARVFLDYRSPCRNPKPKTLIPSSFKPISSFIKPEPGEPKGFSGRRLHSPQQIR